MNLEYYDYVADFFNQIKESGHIQQQALQDEDLELCPKCGEVLYPIIENNGFNGEEGESMEEYTGWECLACGYQE